MSKRRSVLHSITLVLDNGAEIEIWHPENVSEEMFTELLNAANTGETWNVGSWDGVRADLHGRPIDTIAMRRVVGWR